MLAIVSRGGSYGAGTPASAADFQLPYLRHMLAFIGLNDVTISRPTSRLLVPTLPSSRSIAQWRRSRGPGRNLRCAAGGERLICDEHRLMKREPSRREGSVVLAATRKLRSSAMQKDPSFRVSGDVLNAHDVGGLEAFWSFSKVELYCLALVQAAISIFLDSREMHEHVLARGPSE